jgi:hypothetical protein
MKDNKSIIKHGFIKQEIEFSCSEEIPYNLRPLCVVTSERRTFFNQAMIQRGDIAVTFCPSNQNYRCEGYILNMKDIHLFINLSEFTCRVKSEYVSNGLICESIRIM